MFNLDTFLTEKVYQEIQVFENASWPFELDTFLTIWARQLCFCLYDNVKINGSDYWEIQPLICKWLCPGQMWIR